MPDELADDYAEAHLAAESGGGVRLRRRGHRAGRDAGSPALGAGGAGADDPSRPRCAAGRGALAARTLQRLSLYVALGDSFTAGAGAVDGEAWPDLLVDRLVEHNPTLALRNLAVDGATSGEVVEQLSEAVELEPDLVTVVCGANDVLRCDPSRLGALRRQPGADPGQAARGAPGRPDRHGHLAGALGLHAHGAPDPPAGRARDLGVQRRHPPPGGAMGVPCLEVAGHPGLSDPKNFNDDGLHPSATRTPARGGGVRGAAARRLRNRNRRGVEAR